ncbi:MAG: NUDIX domain-containing protein [Anaerolineaceae bacterium]|nr:NUDIX domain-containing protein [Anaerolineaceae bacterium]
MAKIVYGDRVGREGKVRLGCAAAVLDASGKKVLLTRRIDNGLWCLPSGGMDAGESLEETCAREVWEETGLRVVVRDLIGLYSSPDVLVIYSDGNKAQIVSLLFAVDVIGGELRTSDETSEYAWFTLEEARKLAVMENHRERIEDLFCWQGKVFLR